MTKKTGVFMKLLSFISYKEKKKVKEFYIPQADEIIRQQEKSETTEEYNTSTKESKGKGIRNPIPVSKLKHEKGVESKKADDDTISEEIAENIRYIMLKFNAPTNKDIIIREFTLGEIHKAFIAYIVGMIDKTIVNNFILRPLLNEEKFKSNERCQLDYVLQSVLETNNSKKITKPSDVVFEILSGYTLLFIDGCDYYISNETKGFPARGVDKPLVEGVITGAQEAFNENLRTN